MQFRAYLKRAALVAALSLVASNIAFAEDIQDFVSVRGEGHVIADATLATIAASVSVQAATKQDAQSQNAIKSLKFLNNLAAQFNLQKGDWTNYLTSNPKNIYSDDNKTLLRVDHVVTNNFRFKIRRMEAVGPFEDAVIAGGGDYGYVSYSLEDSKPQKKQAYQNAYLDALSKAETLARQAGKFLTGKLQVTEHGASAPVFTKAVSLGAPERGGSAISSDVTPTQVDVSAYVDVVFFLGDKPANK